MAEPAPLPIVQAGTPVLRERAVELEPSRIADPQVQELIDRMIATMRAAPGVGLAAPQIGLGLRIFVAEDPQAHVSRLSAEERAAREREAFDVRVFVNPVLRSIGDQKVGFYEGCLSVNGFVGHVERYTEVEVTGLDRQGQPQTWRARGWAARILQHEMDHLDGTLYIDRMQTRTFANAEVAAALKLR